MLKSGRTEEILTGRVSYKPVVESSSVLRIVNRRRAIKTRGTRVRVTQSTLRFSGEYKTIPYECVQ